MMLHTFPPGLAVDESYGARLHRLIKEPERRMLLDANVVWNRTNQNASAVTDRAVFETASERFHRTVITLWELFDERREYAECVTELAKKARAIRNDRRFSVIVSSTLPARHLAQNMQPEIEAEDEPLILRHLGPYPFVMENVGVPSFAGEGVLLLGDIVDSGRALGNLARAVRALGGNPVAALCLTLVNPDLIGTWETSGVAPAFRPTDGVGDGAPLYALTCDLPAASRRGESEHRVPFYPLTCYPIADTKRGEFDPEKTIRLDPETQLPIPLPGRLMILPQIDRVRMYRHLEQSKAIITDLFRTESGLVTTAVRFVRLFEHAGDEIWKTVEPHFRPEPAEVDDPEAYPVLVTTYDRGDTRFKEFVEDRVTGAHPLETVLVGRRSDGEYFILDHRTDRLAGRRAVLLLASAQSAQKIRDLSALLASYSVGSIRVVCLLNRMGPQTAHFVGRIARLLRGLGNQKGGQVPRSEKRAAQDEVPFSFHPTYQLDDLPADRLRSVLDTVRSLFDYYHAETRVPSFRRWLVQVRGYFSPQSVTTSEFATKDPDPLPHQQLVRGPNDEVFHVNAEDTMLSVLASRVATDRQYRALVDQLVAATGRRVIYKLFILLLADIGYMKKTGQFRDLRDKLDKRVGDIQGERLRIERDAADNPAAERLNEIDRLVDLETHFLFGWALISFLDDGFDYTALVFKVLSAGVPNPTDWHKYPETFERFYGEERVAWMVSFLTTLSHLGFGNPERAPGLKKRLAKYVRGLVAVLPQVVAARERRSAGASDQAKSRVGPTGGGSTSGSDQTKSRELRVKSNLDMLLTEFGAHDLQQPVQVIRFLHSQLLKPKQRHSPIDTNINQALSGLDLVIGRNKSAIAVPQRRVSFTDPAVLSRLDDAIYVAGQLQTMSEASARLLFFAAPNDPAKARATVSSPRYFTTQPPEAGFASDVMRLGDTLQRIRAGKRVSQDECAQLNQLRNLIQESLWDKHSALRVTLLRYVTPLEPTLVAGLQAAVRAFEGQRYEKVWKAEVERYEQVAAADARCVLIDPLLLKEVLKNVFSNVRYNLDEYEKPKKLHYAHLVDVEISQGPPLAPDDSADPLPRLRVLVVSKGRRFKADKFESKPHTTFRQHQEEVAKVGGELHIRPYQDRDHKGTQVELLLIDRTEHRELLPKTAPSATS